MTMGPYPLYSVNTVLIRAQTHRTRLAAVFLEYGSELVLTISTSLKSLAKFLSDRITQLGCRKL